MRVEIRVEIIEGHLMPDHIHMLVSIPPKISISSFMGYLKGKSALMIFDRHANLKYKFGNRHFWAEVYYVSTVGLNGGTYYVSPYIRCFCGKSLHIACGVVILLPEDHLSAGRRRFRRKRCAGVLPQRDLKCVSRKMRCSDMTENRMQLTFFDAYWVDFRPGTVRRCAL